MKDAAVRRWALVAAVSLARMAFGYQFQSLASLGPELLERFGLGYAELGGLIGLYMAPGVLVALPGGLLGRRYGERLVVGGGLALMTLGAAVCAGAGGPGGIGAGRALAGVGAVMLVVMQGKIIGDRFPGRSFLPVMGLVVGAFPVGVGLVELTHGPVVRALGWPGMFIVGAGIAALAFLLFLVSSERAHPDAGAAWALPSRRECGLVAVAGVVWTAYNAGYYGFLSYMPSVLAARGHPPGVLALVLTVATWLNLPATVLGGGAGGAVRQPSGVPGGDGGGDRGGGRGGVGGLAAAVGAAVRHGGVPARGRHHRRRHAVGAAGEPGGGDGAVLRHLLCRRDVLACDVRAGGGPGGRSGWCADRGGCTVGGGDSGLHAARVPVRAVRMIRPVLPDDAEAVADLIRIAFAAIPVPLDPAPSALRETPDSIRAHLAEGGGALVEGPAACILWSVRDGGLYVGRLATHPAHRGQGLAGLLTAAAEAEARRRGLPRLHLGVRLALPGNRRLFARLGFTETRLHTHDGYPAPTWTEAERWLTAPPTETGTPPG